MTRNRINAEDIAHIGKLFLVHRGRNKGLFKPELYEEYYGQKWNPQSSHFYEQVAKWNYLRSLMKYLRKKGDHFIVYEPMGVGKFKYYLIGSRDEGEHFKQFLQKVIEAHQRTQERCEKYMVENLDNRVKIGFLEKFKQKVET